VEQVGYWFNNLTRLNPRHVNTTPTSGINLSNDCY